MSEESKTAEGDYVMMGSGVTPGRGPSVHSGLEDPNLTQEEKDHRLAIALQQQENAAAFDQHKKKHEEFEHANDSRTARSGTFTKLQAVRQKDHGKLTVPAEYTSDGAYVSGDSLSKPGSSTHFAPPPKNATPQELADYKLAIDLQKVEQVGAGTVREMAKIVEEELHEEEAQAHRTQRSNYHINQKGFGKH
jgi:hypothetical protein